MFTSVAVNVFSQEQNVEVPYTLADRERLVRLEVKMDEMSKSVDYRFEEVNKRFDKLENAFYGLIYSIFGLIGVFIAVLVWDRRKTLYPVQLDVMSVKDIQKEDHNKVKKLEETLNRLAEKDSKIREAMKHAGLL
jgi:tetrahydromethanopterin S-methyltransferase subunit G